MKKLMFLLVAVAALAFVGCKKGETKSADDVKTELQESLDKKDSKSLKEKIEGVKDNIMNWVKSGKIDEAGKVLTTVQGFLKDNKDKISEVVGDNAFVSGALSTLDGLDIPGLTDKAKEAVGGDDKEKAEEKAEEKKE